MEHLITSSHEHRLQAALNRVGNRGIYCDPIQLEIFRQSCVVEINSLLAEISIAWNIKCVNERNKKGDGTLNLASPSQLLQVLLDKGFNVPIKRKAQRYGTDELTLLKIFAQSKDPCLEKILRIREIVAVLGKFVNAILVEDNYHCVFNASGTVTGRRSSKKHTFGIGNNAQNWPKYNDLGQRYRKCFKTRPNKIFLSSDQKLAEDWGVMALSNSAKGLAELRAGADRHKKLASFIFQVKEEDVTEWPQRFLGKKSRHAFNYGMYKDTFSETLAREGYPLSPQECQYLLEAVHRYDPSVKDVFHYYVQVCIEKTRTLVSPLGRERVFYGFRPNDNNLNLWNEAFSWIPQSTIADNNGLAIVYLDNQNDYMINECHDSILQELPDDFKTLWSVVQDTIKAYDRTIVFHNEVAIKIPIEFEMGYCLGEMQKLKAKEITEDVFYTFYKKLQGELHAKATGNLA